MVMISTPIELLLLNTCDLHDVPYLSLIIVGDKLMNFFLTATFFFSHLPSMTIHNTDKL